MSHRSSLLTALALASVTIISAQQLKSGIDPHAWAEFRANGPLGNVDGFYTAFGVKPGDKLYREPGQRVKIW